MAKKERMNKKDKPLEKMTAKELRELGLTIPELTGVHGMNKAELITAIKEVRGIKEEKKEKGQDIRELKKKIKGKLKPLRPKKKRLSSWAKAKRTLKYCGKKLTGSRKKFVEPHNFRPPVEPQVRTSVVSRKKVIIQMDFPSFLKRPDIASPRPFGRSRRVILQRNCFQVLEEGGDKPRPHISGYTGLNAPY